MTGYTVLHTPMEGCPTPPCGGADTPMEQFWAETPVPNVLRAKLLFPFCLPVTIIFRFNILNVTGGLVIVCVQWRDKSCLNKGTKPSFISQTEKAPYMSNVHKSAGRAQGE